MQISHRFIVSTCDFWCWNYWINAIEIKEYHKKKLKLIGPLIEKKIICR